jgi:sugar/nucleoside kinase (ribokinase family)
MLYSGGMREILIAGTLCWDRICRVPRLPEPGGYVDVTDIQERPGGEGLNTALALRTWGVDTVFYTNPVGAGSDADRLRRAVEQGGLRRAVMPGGKNPTPVCTIYVTPDGERTMFGHGFSELEEVTSQLHVNFTRGGWFSVDMNFGESGRRLVRGAASAGMNIYAMDLIGDEEPLPPGSILQTSTDWKGKWGDEAVNLAYCADTSTKYQNTVILTDAGRGLYIGVEGQASRLPVFPAPEVVDATGAGDIFRAGMLFGLRMQWPLSQCMSFAAGAGALECMYPGANYRIPSRDGIEKFIQDHPGILSAY